VSTLLVNILRIPGALSTNSFAKRRFLNASLNLAAVQVVTLSRPSTRTGIFEGKIEK